MTFLECCQTVREHGLRMIRPREHTPGLYDIREPFEAGAGWVWLDATTANVVCQIFDALSQDPAGIRDPEILLEGRKWHIAFI